jgi:hypothetical protein
MRKTDIKVGDVVALKGYGRLSDYAKVVSLTATKAEACYYSRHSVRVLPGSIVVIPLEPNGQERLWNPSRQANYRVVALTTIQRVVIDLAAELAQRQADKDLEAAKAAEAARQYAIDREYLTEMAFPSPDRLTPTQAHEITAWLRQRETP